MLSINKLVYQWPGSTSQQVNLEASAGKIVLISGPSGIGKSTFFDIISGFHEPISGSVIFREENLLEKPPWKRPVSTMFQSNNFFPHLSVEDNLRLSIKKTPYPIEKIKKKLLYLGILPIVNRKTSKLSGGELQRTALIKTLLREEPILLLDEPFSALEPDMVYKASELIEKHTQKLQSITLIISHQDLNSYLPISQRLELG